MSAQHFSDTLKGVRVWKENGFASFYEHKGRTQEAEPVTDLLKVMLVGNVRMLDVCDVTICFYKKKQIIIEN